MNSKKVVLLILDGVGVNKEYDGNAIGLAKTKTLDKLADNYPYLEIGASEQYVGLPKEQLGGSEVGHTTIGAGHIIDSDIVRINNTIKNKTFYKNKNLLSILNKVKSKNKLHLVGLLSDGGVHSHINHLLAILDVVKKKNIKNVYLHLFSDGRDVTSKSLLKYIIKLKYHLTKLNLLEKVQIGSISGRYYGMDRDNRWDRLSKVYHLITKGEGNVNDSIDAFIKISYKKGVTDEFLTPTLFDKNSLVKTNDTVLFFNFRSDRAREFTKAFVDPKFNKFKRKRVKVNFASLTQYDSKIKNIKVIFPPIKVIPGLGQILSKKGYNQLRVAETEKFAHVTYFFNQGQEFPNKGEDRILIHSPKVKTYDLEPEMSAIKLTDKLISKLKKNYKLVVVNYANGDMVGHTGNIKAATKAIEVIDRCISKVIKAIDKDTIVIVTADHGNCDQMLFNDYSISTSHSLNKVPFILYSKTNDYKLKSIKNANLSNIAPTILDIMDIKIPTNMEKSLLKKR